MTPPGRVRVRGLSRLFEAIKPGLVLCIGAGGLKDFRIITDKDGQVMAVHLRNGVVKLAHVVSQ